MRLDIKSRDRKRLAGDLVFILGFLAVFALIFDRRKYGFVSNDEAFYLTVPFRLLQGDAMLVDEWNPAQLSGALLYPLAALFDTIKEGTTGVYLWFRTIYVLSQCCMGLIVYISLRRVNIAAAIVSALSVMIFAPNGIMALSYITIAIDGVILATLLMLSARSARLRKTKCFLAGLIFAAAVLCCPHLAVGYFIYALILLGARLMKKGRPHIEKNFMLLTAGCAAAAFAFFAFVLSRASFNEVLEALPFILSDAEHQGSVLSKITSYFTGIINHNSALPIYALLLILALTCSSKRIRQKYELIAFSVAALLSILLLGQYDWHISLLVWPINILALFPMLLRPSRQMKIYFHYIYLPGMLYSFCSNLSSNQNMFAIGFASVTASVGSVTIIAEYLRGARKRCSKKTMSITLLPVLLYVGIFAWDMVDLRYNYVYRTQQRNETTVYIEDGPGAGLMYTEWQAEWYWQVSQEMARIKDRAGERLCVYSPESWCYLAADGFENCAYSAWLSVKADPESTYHKIQHYYRLRPEKCPDAVWMEKRYWDDRIMTLLCDDLGYTMEEMEYGCAFYRPGI